MGEQGGPCDKSCEFCYYAHQKSLVFYDFPTLLNHANLFRHYYGLDACDITGGEATIYKTPSGDIVDLVAHCARIGLKPTIISHGQNNRDDWKLGRPRPLYQEIEDAGLEDWLISLHGGSAASHDKILGSEGSFDRVIAGLDLVNRPVRFNSTIVGSNYRDFPTNVLKDRPPTVLNLIAFNPFHAWHEKTGLTEIDFQIKYDEAAPYVARAVDDLEKIGWEVNVRYFPICVAEKHGFAENVSGYHQVPYDPWEWRLNVTARTPLESIEKQGGWVAAERNMATQMLGGRSNETCGTCANAMICDAPQPQYQKKYGLDELLPIVGAARIDPLHYQKHRGVPLLQVEEKTA
jgi:sulfatase maturation enzyme AslB (radical SAM superfamily)